MVAHKRRTECSLVLRPSTSAAQYRCGTINIGAGFIGKHGELARMTISRGLRALLLGDAIAAVAGCQTAAPPPPPVPAAFTALGTSAPYLMGDVIGGSKARAA